MKKKIGIKILGIMTLLAISTTTFGSVYAVSQGDVKSVNDKIADAKDDLGEVQNDKTAALKTIEELTDQIREYQEQVDSLNTQISDLNGDIKNAQNELDTATQEHDKQEDLLNQRLVTLYEAGDTTYLDVLLTSKDVTDFISNYFLVSELASYDTELLEKIETQRKQIENAKNELEFNKTKLEETKKEQVTKSNALKAKKTEKDSQVAKLSQEEKSIQSDIDRFESDKRKIQQELEELARKSNVAAPSNPSACGYIFPVLGLGKGNIANKSYPSYAGHTGIDVNIGVAGKTIAAVKDGTVVKSEASMSGGRYVSYGEHIIIDHHDGTMTLYAHGLPGSRRVSTGQSVKQGQAIMTVGTTGNSTGLHLHFEVRIKGSPVNPLPYLP